MQEDTTNRATRLSSKRQPNEHIAPEQPVVSWTPDGTALQIQRPTDFDDDQWHQMVGEMTIWWAVYSAELVVNARARAAMRACPDAPPCPTWCTVEHENAYKGWEMIEKSARRPIPDSVQKDCSAHLGLAHCDDGTIAVELHRMACVDHHGTRWDELYVGEETISLHPDNEFSRMNHHQVGAFQAILELGKDTLAAPRATGAES